MPDSDFIPIEQFDTARCLMLNWQADSLLSVVAPMLHAMQSAQTGTVESAVQLYEARQTFRDCVESLCRDLSADETEQLLMITLVTLCERLTSQT
ncbi:MAG: hypothetical protein HQ518_28540 [Rhodopirellula sp.]|nr:hypothetical protein [Rhodopirellula sp.]